MAGKWIRILSNFSSIQVEIFPPYAGKFVLEARRTENFIRYSHQYRTHRPCRHSYNHFPITVGKTDWYREFRFLLQQSSNIWMYIRNTPRVHSLLTRFLRSVIPIPPLLTLIDETRSKADVEQQKWQNIILNSVWWIYSYIFQISTETRVVWNKLHVHTPEKICYQYVNELPP